MEGRDPRPPPRDRGEPPVSGGGRPRRPPARTRLRNRRFAAPRQLIREGRYFSEQEMRARAPRLYQRYIGRFRRGGDPQTPAGDPAEPPPGPPSLARLLLRALDEETAQERLQHQEDDSSDEDGDPPCGRAVDAAPGVHHPHVPAVPGRGGRRFRLQVDENPDMDNLDIVSRDAEERYFDEEEPSAAPQLD